MSLPLCSGQPVFSSYYSVKGQISPFMAHTVSSHFGCFWREAYIEHLQKDGELIRDPEGRIKYTKLSEFDRRGSTGIQRRGPRSLRQPAAMMKKRVG